MSGNMQKENFYLVLGTEKEADLKQIKEAYRSCCKKYHPDSGGAYGAADKFQQVQEAYETLSDSDRREAYNRSLEKETVPVRHSFSENQQTETVRPHEYHEYNFDTYISSLMNSIMGNFMGSFMSNKKQADEYECDLILSKSEAARGGMYRITLPREAGGRELKVDLPPGVYPGSRKEIRIKTNSHDDIKVVVSVVVV